MSPERGEDKVELAADIVIIGGGGAGLAAAVTAAAVALGAAVIEAISPWGIDNLTVPAVSTMILVLMLL